ncbi:protein translocase subunit SecF [Patescibacteria group bacterium]|nr:protein translocase subunit SecF [Patescibacteria group bacterium]
MFIIKYRKFFIALSIAFVVLSFTALAVFGLPLGIDFKGGTSIELAYTTPRPEVSVIKNALTAAGYEDVVIQPTGAQNIILKSSEVTDQAHLAIVSAVKTTGDVEQVGFTAIGPSVGKELKNKAILAIIMVLIAIILFIAYAFRKVSQPVSSWKFGLAAIIALAHDVAIPLGAFAIISHYTGAELDTLFIVAILTTLALSVADTIVVFDRVREHLGNNKKQSFPELVGDSLRETFARSINTSAVVLVMVISLAVFGPESTQLFATVLAIGLFFGTYSSIFLASPILVFMEQAQSKKK